MRSFLHLALIIGLISIGGRLFVGMIAQVGSDLEPTDVGLGTLGALALATGLIMFRRRFMPTPPEPPDVIDATEPVTIADFPPGTVQKIVGRVSFGEHMLRAPLTGRVCAGYDVSIHEDQWVVYQYQAESGSGDHLSIREKRAVPFMITDSTGRARIDPGGAELLLVNDHQTQSGWRSGAMATSEQEAFLNKHGERSTVWFLPRSINYSEGVIKPGDEVAVFGYGCLVEDPEAPGTTILELREADHALMRIHHAPRAPAETRPPREPITEN